MPFDECMLHPQTKERVGPSTLAGTIFVLMAILVTIGTVANSEYAVQHRKRITVLRLVFVLLGIGLHLYGLYVYWTYYRFCQAWTGWFMLLLCSLIGSGLVAWGLSFPEPEPEREVFDHHDKQQ